MVSTSTEERRHVFVKGSRAYSCAHAMSPLEYCAPMVVRFRKTATETVASLKTTGAINIQGIYAQITA